MNAFTGAEKATLLSRLGYGNPAGPLWFLGMEEALKSERDTNLRWRLESLAFPIDSVTSLLKAPWPKVGTSPTWRMMAQIALSLIDGHPLDSIDKHLGRVESPDVWALG